MTRHNGRDGVLIDQLQWPSRRKEHAEVIEPSHYALQLHPVHQENGERDLGLADVIKEGVL
jgi:hypothetical protein